MFVDQCGKDYTLVPRILPHYKACQVKQMSTMLPQLCLWTIPSHCIMGELLTFCLSVYQSISHSPAIPCKLRSLSVLPAIQLSPGPIITNPPVPPRASDWQFVRRVWLCFGLAESSWRWIRFGLTPLCSTFLLRCPSRFSALLYDYYSYFIAVCASDVYANNILV